MHKRLHFANVIIKSSRDEKKHLEDVRGTCAGKMEKILLFYIVMKTGILNKAAISSGA
jgi:hypothetical protein